MSRYERLSDEAKARVLAELAQEYALGNLRPVQEGLRQQEVSDLCLS
jgi:hypothetical protein